MSRKVADSLRESEPLFASRPYFVNPVPKSMAAQTTSHSESGSGTGLASTASGLQLFPTALRS